jgi:hypothetical protein
MKAAIVDIHVENKGIEPVDFNDSILDALVKSHAAVLS